MERKINKAEINGERKHNLVTFNPTSAKMGEKLYVTVPKLDPSPCIVPGTTNLVYNLKNSNDKSWPLNNLNRLFVQGLQVKIGREVVYDNTGEGVFRLYKDLWMSDEKRSAMTSHGICSEETRKHLGGSSDASTPSKTSGTLDLALGKSLVKNRRIALGQILDDHGLHSPAHVNFETRYTITLPDNSTNIGDMQSSQTVGNFTLENLQLEYDTIRNEGAAKSVASSYDSGKNLVIEHVSLETVSEWDKDATSINENLHIRRESMKAIVMLFKWVDQKMDEDFIYPKITEVSTSVNGKPNAIHSSAIKTDDLEREARRYFENNYVSTGKFFSTQFALVLDFRSVKDQFKYNDGVKVDGSSGIQVACN